jgi:hypothetical protein
MKPIIEGLIIGLAIGGMIAGGTSIYRNSDAGQTGRCVEIYGTAADSLSLNPMVMQMVKSEGFSNIDDMLKSRCEKWVKSGEKF